VKTVPLLNQYQPGTTTTRQYLTLTQPGCTSVLAQYHLLFWFGTGAALGLYTKAYWAVEPGLVVINLPPEINLPPGRLFAVFVSNPFKGALQSDLMIC